MKFNKRHVHVFLNPHCLRQFARCGVAAGIAAAGCHARSNTKHIAAGGGEKTCALGLLISIMEGRNGHRNDFKT